MSRFTVVNTRPEHQAISLDRKLEHFGLDIIHFPTLKIQSTNSNQIKAINKQLQDYDIAIFLSVNAVLCSHLHWLKPFPIKRVIAIGPGTSEALKEQGFIDVLLPNQFNSEGILALPYLKQINHQKIVIYSGREPRDLLHRVLSHRGAKIKRCECYQRVFVTPDPALLSLLKHKELNAIVSTSKDSLKSLNLALSCYTAIKTVPLIVISDGMRNLAMTQRWKSVHLASDASNEAIVKALLKLKAGQISHKMGRTYFKE